MNNDWSDHDDQNIAEDNYSLYYSINSYTLG